MPKIENITGMSPVYAKRLTDIGIKTTEDLLAAGRSAKGREELVKKNGHRSKVNHGMG
jgi:hypothetical protein